MMAMKYYLNLSEELHNSSHSHKIHRANCYWILIAQEKKYLGEHLNDEKALGFARATCDGNHPIEGCEYCCLDLYDIDRQLNLFS